MKEGISSLRKNEDYWAIWFGFIIIFGALLGWTPKVPKIGNWSDSPLDAFLAVKDGVVSGDIVGPLLILTVCLAALTAIGIAFMKTDKPWRYLPGFAGVFVLSCLACRVAHQTNIKYWGLSYAMWALLIGLVVAWIVTPMVAMFLYVFGTRWLRMRNKKLVMIVAGANSVCEAFPRVTATTLLIRQDGNSWRMVAAESED